jgi:uncharacterized repeat protein (TIGR03803 family)
MAATNRLNLVFGLPLRNQETLDRLVRDLYDPGSPSFRRYLTPGQFAEQFGPAPQDYATLAAFAKRNGLTVTGTHPNRTLLDVSGTVGDIEKALRLKMHLYQHPTEQRTFYAPDAEPLLDLALPVLMVSGLDNYSLPRPAGLKLKPLDQSPGPVPSVAGSGPRGFLIGQDFRAAYAQNVSLDGAGQVVGLLEMDGYYTNDVLAYENLAGLPNVPISSVLVGGFNGRPGSLNAELALDIDMVLCMAPGLSKIILYQAGASGNPYDVLNHMANDTNSFGQVAARQLSSSWSWTSPSTAAQNQVFLQFVAQGQSFFQSSEDNGAYCGGGCVPGTPVDNPNVTVVGGTSLTTSIPGQEWLSETVWSWFPGTPAATGGGFGTNYALPSWQQGIDMSRNGGSTRLRNSPDVACVAEAIWIVANNGEQFDTAGTSASAPLWAGLAALANQQAAAIGQPPIGFINPALYAIGKSSKYATTFHDTTIGNNTNMCCGTNRFYACPGYDLCTGWGTPIGSNLISALITPPVPLNIIPATPLAFGGPFAGPFRPASLAFVLTNDTSTPFDWTLTKTDAWLRASSYGGTLTNGGPAMTVNVMVNPAATNLPVGSYTATLWFTNLADGIGQSRLVTLAIVAPPVINSQPVSQSVPEGTTATFAVVVSNSTACAYQWMHDSGTYVTNVSDGSGVSGSTSSALLISNVVAANAGAYWVVVSNAASSVTSSQAFLGVLPWRPIISSQPTSQAVQAGQTVSFSVGAGGSQPLSYSWQRNGSALRDGGNISGSASSTLTLRSVAVADAGSYSVLVSNAAAVASSSGALLTVHGIASSDAMPTTVYSFAGGNDGANPNALLRAADGNFYGTTADGGTNLAGTVFRLSPGGTVLPIYSFRGAEDGANPLAGLIQGVEGDFYGTAYQGGASDNGTVFRITPAGALTTLVGFNINNGDLPYGGLIRGQDGNFYGTTYQGGAGNRGTAFKASPSGVLTTLYNFNNGADGGHIAAGLLQASDGNFYGTTYKGGASGNGTVFRLSAGGLLTTLVSFNNANGALPLAELVQDPAGVLYGTTSSGGAYNYGVLFRMTSSGMLPNPYSFTGGGDGSYPAAALLLGSDGNFYGTTAYGGVYGAGTLFRMTPNGVLTTLVAFNGYAGANPQAALVEDADGTLVGTTQNGGASDAGVIFRLGFGGPLQITGQPASQTAYSGDNVVLSVAVSGTPPFSYQWQKNGTNLLDGGNLTGSTRRVLTLAGVTSNGAGTYSVLVSSSGSATNSDAALLTVLSSPPVITSSPTNLAPNACTIVTFNVAAVGSQPLNYEWQKNGINLTDTCSLLGSSSSTLVISNVTEADNGTYTAVVTNSVGSTNISAVLTLVPKTVPCTTLTTRHWFTGGSDGRSASGLTQGTNGLLYGATYAGSHSSWGTIFSLTGDGVFTTLVTFMQTNGSNPTAAPVQGADGRFYGTTFAGGDTGSGTVYAMTTDGAVSTLYSLNGISDGANPSGPLAQGTDGNFYGTANSAGGHDFGCVFRVTPGGAFTNLYSFTGGIDGQNPVGGLALGTDGNFYGLIPTGGAAGLGSFFRITPSGVLATLYSFTGGTDGARPVGTPALGRDGSFFGTASQNGLGQRGTVFKLTPSGTLTTLHAFGNLAIQDGIYPSGGVVQSSDGNLYGTTYADYRSGYGTLFRVSPDGSTFATLLYFDGCNDGSQPQTALMEDAAGYVYGTTSGGGPCRTSQGTLFRFAVDCVPQITAQPASQAVVIGANVQFSVAATGARPLTFQWQRNGTNLLDGGNVLGATNLCLNLTNVALADAGTYSVVVSNALTPITSSPAQLVVVYPPTFLSAASSNCTLALTYSTIPGQKYRLQYKPSATASNWTFLGPSVFPTSNAVTAYDNACTNAQRFYRVVLTPQTP